MFLSGCVAKICLELLISCESLNLQYENYSRFTLYLCTYLFTQFVYSISHQFYAEHSLQKKTHSNPPLSSIMTQTRWDFLEILFANCVMCHLTNSNSLSLCSQSALSTVLRSNILLKCLSLVHHDPLFTAPLLLLIIGRNTTLQEQIDISL